MIKDIVTSKKWVAIFVAIFIALLVNYKLIDSELGKTIIGMLGIGVIGQAIADNGKEAVKLSNKTGTLLILLLLLPSCGVFLKETKLKTIDCVTDSLAKELFPAVETILLGNKPSWENQLESLTRFARESGICAVKAAIKEFEKPTFDSTQSEDQNTVGLKNALTFLEKYAPYYQ